LRHCIVCGNYTGGYFIRPRQGVSAKHIKDICPKCKDNKEGLGRFMIKDEKRQD